MQRNRETNLQRLLSQFSDLRRQSTGGNRDVPRPDSNSPRRIDDSYRAHQVVQICQRFAHAHEDDVVDLFSALPLDRYDLIDNFVRAQIARKPVQPASAEFTSVPASDLA